MQILLERGWVTGKAAQTCLDHLLGVAADGGQPVGPRPRTAGLGDIAPQCVDADVVGMGQPGGVGRCAFPSERCDRAR